MRVLVLTFYYEPDLCAGSFRNTAFIDALKNNLTEDDEVDIVTTMPNRYSSFVNIAQEEKKIGNINIKRIKIPTHKSGMIDQSISFLIFAFKSIFYILKREKYQIVYASSSRFMTAFLGALVSNFQRAKLFLDIRDIFTDTMENIFSKSKFKHLIKIFKLIESYSVNSASHINLVSKGFENYFKKINNKVEYSFYPNGIDKIFLNYNFYKDDKNKKKIITYAGNIGEGQGLEKIIPYIARLIPENYEIQVVGDGGRKKILENSIADLSNVKLYSSVNRKELLAIYKNSDYLFIHLNNYDAFKKVLPSKIFEFAVTNKYIIAGVSGYAKDFIEKNINGVVVFNPCDPEDFYKKFSSINFEKIDRVDFIKKFNRDLIMKKLSKKVYEL